MATTTNYGWTTPDDTDLVKDGAAAIRTLGSSIDTSFAADEGDLLVGGTSDIFEALPIGAAGTVLTSDGDTAEWAAVSAGFSTFTSYTPTEKGGWTVGNGTLTGQYATSGNLVWYQGMLVFGSTTNVSGSNIGFSLPFNIITTFDDAAYAMLGYGFARDNSASLYYITSRVASPNQNDMFFNGQIDIWDANTPIATWAVNDRITWSVMYRKQ
jgi:hypothetical protein